MINLTNVSRENMLTVLDSVPNIIEFDDVRVRQSVRIGNYRMSIQASGGHYCTPRYDFPHAKANLSDYQQWEVAVYNTNDNMSCPLRLRKRFGHEYEFNPKEKGGVFGYIDKETVLDMIEALK